MTRHRLWLAALAMLVPLASLDGGFVWRDHAVVEQLPVDPGWQDWFNTVTGPFVADRFAAPAASQYYRPLVSLATQLERSIFGAWVPGYRLTNLVTHLFCVLLVLRFIRLRVPDAAPGWVALSVAVFVLHPSRVEAVGSISGRADVWMAIFVLLAADAARRRGLTFLTMLMSVAAMLCKETALMLPLLIAVDAWASPRRGSGEGLRPMRVAPALASAAGIGFAWLLRNTMVPMPPGLLDALLQDPLRALSTLGHYLQAALLPFWPQVVIAPRELQGPPGLHAGLGAALLLALPVGAAATRRLPRLRPWVGDLGWLVVPLLPALNLLPLGLPGLASQRMLYLPMAGVCLLLARALSSLPRPGIAAVVLGGWLVCVGGVSLVYARAWTSDRALWSYELSHAPGRQYAIEQLGREAERQGRSDEALDHYLVVAELARARGDHRVELRASLRAAGLLGSTLSPDDAAGREALQGFYAAVAAGGEAQLSVGEIRRGVEVTTADAAWAADHPRLWLVPRAHLYMQAMDYPAALSLLDRALDLDPHGQRAYLMRARARALTGDLRAARKDVEAAQARFAENSAMVALSERIEAAERRAKGARGDQLLDAEVALIFDAPAEAERILRARREATSAGVQWWLLSVRAARMRGNTVRAQALLQEARDLFPEASAELDGLAQ